MKKTIAIFCLTALISACTSSASQTYTSSGVAGYRVVCGGAFGDGDMGSCYQKAGEICTTQGYRVLQTTVSSIIFECRTSEDANKPLNN